MTKAEVRSMAMARVRAKVMVIHRVWVRVMV
jgi:hypothetical protein